MDPGQAAAALIDLNRRELEPLYVGYTSGSMMGTLFGARLGVLTGGAEQAGRAYVRLAGAWYDQATRLLQEHADEDRIWDDLGVWIDKTVAQRSEVVASGVGLADPLDAATQGFVTELLQRIRALGGYVPSPPELKIGVGVLVALVLVVVLSR